MATVSGITVARAQEIEDATVVSGHVSGGNLYLTTHGGEEVNAGQVVPTLPPLVAAWPVGSIFMTTVATNPATLLGGGTWVRWGQGRVPVSLDSAQVEFDSVEEIGGEKSHVLSSGEMPVHSHGVNDPSHAHDSGWFNFQTNAGAGGSLHFARQGFGGIGTAGAFTGISIQNAGGGAAHNNLQPYIVCYMWKRTA